MGSLIRTSPMMAMIILLALIAGAIGATYLTGNLLAHGGPVAGGVIHACVDEDGKIEIVATGNTCTDDDDDGDDDGDGDGDDDGGRTALDWNAVGPPGSQGAAGATGAQGAAGSTGSRPQG